MGKELCLQKEKLFTVFRFNTIRVRNQRWGGGRGRIDEIVKSRGIEILEAVL